MAEKLMDDNAFDLAFEAAATNTPLETPIVETKETPIVETKETPIVEAKETPVVETKETPVVEAKETPVVETKETPVVVAPATKAPVQPSAEENAAAAKAAAEALVAAAAKENPTEEEKATIERVKEDFPEVAALFEAYQRMSMAKVENVLSAKLAELTSQFTQRMAPTEAVAQQMAKNAHEASILKVHPDAFTILPQVEAWVAKKPSFLQKAYNTVLDGGTDAEIIDFLNVYKKETGSAQTPAPAEPAPSSEEVADKEKRLNAQEGVRGRATSSGRAAVDPNDFDGAFEKFAATA